MPKQRVINFKREQAKKQAQDAKIAVKTKINLKQSESKLLPSSETVRRSLDRISEIDKDMDLSYNSNGLIVIPPPKEAPEKEFKRVHHLKRQQNFHNRRATHRPNHTQNLTSQSIDNEILRANPPNCQPSDIVINEVREVDKDMDLSNNSNGLIVISPLKDAPEKEFKRVHHLKRQQNFHYPSVTHRPSHTQNLPSQSIDNEILRANPPNCQPSDIVINEATQAAPIQELD